MSSDLPDGSGGPGRLPRVAPAATNDLILSLTAQIVAARERQISGEAENLSETIREVYSALRDIGNGVSRLSQDPAVPIEGSVFPDHIICLEDGKKFRMLKRHLKTAFNMTADDYRRKWGLPRDYPMVAPTFAATRSKISREHCLRHGPVSTLGSAPRRERGRPQRASIQD